MRHDRPVGFADYLVVLGGTAVLLALQGLWITRRLNCVAAALKDLRERW